MVMSLLIIDEINDYMALEIDYVCLREVDFTKILSIKITKT